MSRSDRVSADDAFAAALVEVGRLQQRVIMGEALIASLRREVTRGQENAKRPGDVGGDDPPGNFSD
jgi:hypothetical protein